MTQKGRLYRSILWRDEFFKWTIYTLCVVVIWEVLNRTGVLNLDEDKPPAIYAAFILIPFAVFRMTKNLILTNQGQLVAATIGKRTSRHAVLENRHVHYMLNDREFKQTLSMDSGQYRSGDLVIILANRQKPEQFILMSKVEDFNETFGSIYD